jgi:hypothetical protein
MERRREAVNHEEISRTERFAIWDEIDISLIDHCLRRSCEERLEAHEAARQLVTELQEAGRKLNAGQP